MNYSWTCGCCGKRFSTLPEGHAFKAPDQWAAMPMAERDSRGKCDSDRCYIKGVGFFVRGCIVIPVIGCDATYIWGVWAAVSERSFYRILDLWDAPDAENEPAHAGRLANDVPIYPPMCGIEVSVHLRSQNQRPSLLLGPTDHPLAREQRLGITVDRVIEITAALAPHHRELGH